MGKRLLAWTVAFELVESQASWSRTLELVESQGTWTRATELVQSQAARIEATELAETQLSFACSERAQSRLEGKIDWYVCP